MKKTKILFFLLPYSLLPINILSSDKWIAVPMVSQAILNTGHTGGEGCQVIQALDIDSTGQFLVFVTDVGGIWKTNDGGDNWYPSNVGFKARGGSAVAIDPNNSNIVLVAASNSTSYGGWHGLYLSEDKGESWTHVLAMTYEGYRDFREAIAFDRNSVSGGRSQIVYWSAPDATEGGPGGFYRSTDGGKTWTKVNNGYGQGFVKVHPTNGIVYVANALGFHRSTDGGFNFTTTFSGPVRGLDVVSSQPNNVYILKQDGVYISTDSGFTFVKRTNTNLDTSCNSTGGPWLLRVSPVNPNRMVIDINCGEMYTARHQYSSNGGNSWSTSNIADTWLALAPYNNRIRAYAWHPTNEYIVYSFGGDFMTKSTDGGAIFRYESDGYNAIMPSAKMNFNVFNPDILLVTSQDYNSYITLDGGRTWKYLNVSGQGWGGFNYGGYAIDATHLVVADAASWGGTRFLKISHDGGNTWISTGLAGNSYHAACGDPTDPNIAFCHQYRTTDKGYTWSVMNNCVAVYTYNPTGNKELYGCNGNGLVRSYDHGITWQTLITLSESIIDVAYDHVRNRAYIATSGKKLYQYDISSSSLIEITSRLPVDNNNSRRVSTVCVDPVDPSIVYAGDHGDVYATSNAVVYSIDAGVTWNRLTKQIGETGPDGGREAGSVRVHPVTRDLWVGGQCYGVWRHPCVKLSITPTNTPYSETPSYTRTNTPTLTITRTFTTTLIFTRTNTPSATMTQTFTYSVTATRTGSPTNTHTNTSTWTGTATITITNSQVATASYTLTLSSTFTATATYTNTRTPTLTFTGTNTPTETSTFTPSRTVTITVIFTQTYTLIPTLTNTNSPSPLFTISHSYTVTQTQTNTRTPTVSMTSIATLTNTITSSSTQTITNTHTPNVSMSVSPTITIPTNSPTPTIIENWKLKIENLILFPNPYNPNTGDLRIGFEITQPAKLIKVSIYTSSLRKIKQIVYEGVYNAGLQYIDIDSRYLKKLSNGTYIAILTAKNNEGTEIRSRATGVIILR